MSASPSRPPRRGVPRRRCRCADVVASAPHRGEQRDDRGGGVQADRVADPGVLGRVCGQHERDAPLPRRDVPQEGVLHGDAGDPRGALGVGHVAGEPVRAGLLERERDGDEAAVEFGDRDLGGGVQRGQPLAAAGPLSAGRGQAQALQDRHVQGGKRADVPFLVGAAGAGRRRDEAAGGQHGHDDRVGGAQRVDQRGLGGAQRGAEHRERLAAGRRHRVGERVHEAGVPGELVRAVVQDGDDRPRPGRGGRMVVRPVEDSPHGVGTGGSKPSPVSVIASDRNRASCRRFSGPPCAR
jgi:hypothetical protein